MYHTVFADPLNVLLSGELEAHFEQCFSLADDRENESKVPFEFCERVVPPLLHGPFEGTIQFGEVSALVK